MPVSVLPAFRCVITPPMCQRRLQYPMCDRAHMQALSRERVAPMLDPAYKIPALEAALAAGADKGKEGAGDGGCIGGVAGGVGSGVRGAGDSGESGR